MAWLRTGRNISAHTVRSCFIPTALIVTMYSELQDGGEDVMANLPALVLELSCQEDAQSRQKETQALVIDAKIRLLFYVRFFAPKTLVEPLENIS